MAIDGLRSRMKAMQMNLFICTFLVCFPTASFGTNSANPATVICDEELDPTAEPEAFCGIPPKRYNRLLECCKNRQILPRISATPHPPVTKEIISSPESSDNVIAPKSPPRRVRPCRQRDCQGVEYCWRPGMKCCGTQTYYRSHQTCCMTTRYKWKIHEDKQASKHVCCGLDAYPRNTPAAIPCPHPVKNNRFWAAKAFKRRTAGQHCKNNKNAAIIVFRRGDDETHYVAQILSMKINPSGKTTSIKTLNVPVDKRSNGDLDGRIFLMLSPTDPLQDVLDLFLNANDVLFRLPKRLKNLKKRRRLLRKCGIPFTPVKRFLKKVTSKKSLRG